MNDFLEILKIIESGQNLTGAQMSSAIGHMLSGGASDELVHRFLTGLHAKGETSEELAGAARALRASMLSIQSTRRPVLDTCGTGGDGSKTFNISTAAAIALAAAGQSVAKHGNRKITSATGSADVLSELGIDLEAPPDIVQQCLEQAGLCFCFAPLFHPAMKHVGAVRRQLAHPTIFNRLGPLANPAGAECQVIGVGTPELQNLLAGALQQLKTQRSLVVCGEDGVDEISISSATRVLEVTPQAIVQHRWTPEMFGLTASDRSELLADDPASSAACIRQVLARQRGPCRDVVIINAAAGLWLVNPGRTLQDCAGQIAKAIDSGEAELTLQRLSTISHQRR
ncbi:MAG TPA: anthranilate phosphoribosyltransferase [Planctomycetaceae bacterium]|nr:anthranilate phosphoribosyltransferase [Planctomycetaceae bacterium]